MIVQARWWDKRASTQGQHIGFRRYTSWPAHAEGTYPYTLHPSDMAATFVCHAQVRTCGAQHMAGVQSALPSPVSPTKPHYQILCQMRWQACAHVRGWIMNWYTDLVILGRSWAAVHPHCASIDCIVSLSFCTSILGPGGTGFQCAGLDCPRTVSCLSEGACGGTNCWGRTRCQGTCPEGGWECELIVAGVRL